MPTLAKRTGHRGGVLNGERPAHTTLYPVAGATAASSPASWRNELPLGRFYKQGPVHRTDGNVPERGEVLAAFAVPAVPQSPVRLRVPTGASYRDEKTGFVLIDKEEVHWLPVLHVRVSLTVCASSTKSRGASRNGTLCSQITANGTVCLRAWHNCKLRSPLLRRLRRPGKRRVQERWRSILPESIHALPDPGNSQPLTRYILSPNVQAGRSWCKWRFNGLWSLFSLTAGRAGRCSRLLACLSSWLALRRWRECGGGVLPGLDRDRRMLLGAALGVAAATRSAQ